MPLSDDNHQVAEIVKDHDERLTDLEEESRSDDVPNQILSANETIAFGDDVDGVRQRDIEPAKWGDGEGATGWGISSWGES